MTRKRIVVDVETNGLNPERHQAVEVAWVDLATGEHDVFIPPHAPNEVLASADVVALRMNRYIDRLADPTTHDMDGEKGRALADRLHGATLVGANPAFDAAFLLKMFGSYEDLEIGGTPCWHHRLWDVEAYAAGVFALTELMGLRDLCEHAFTDRRPDHTALADALATAELVRYLDEQAVRNPAATG